MTTRLDAAEFRRALARGWALWNAHRFFECHEAWEDLWQSLKHEKKREPAQDPRRDLVHGLILLAAAYHHWMRGNTTGAGRKLAEARRLLEPFGNEPEGIPLDWIRRDVFFDLERSLRGEAVDAARIPRAPSDLVGGL